MQPPQTPQPALQCPATNADAGGNTGLCRVYVPAGASGGKLLCDRNPGETGRRFLNTNGFADADFPLTKSTGLEALDLDSPTGGGCWALQESDLEIGISPCKLTDSSQKLYVRSPLPLYLHPPTLSSSSPLRTPTPAA